MKTEKLNFQWFEKEDRRKPLRASLGRDGKLRLGEELRKRLPPTIRLGFDIKNRILAIGDGYGKGITDLKDAKRIITKDGFNRKQTEAIIVLHNLESVPYALHIETEDGLRPVSVEEARGNKKLFVSWI